MRGKLFETEIDSAELTLRIAESCLGMRRPPMMSAKEALAQLRAVEPEHIAGFDRAAMRAAEYFFVWVCRFMTAETNLSRRSGRTC